MIRFVDAAVPAEHREAAKNAYLKMLRGTLLELYRGVVQAEEQPAIREPGTEDARFFEDAVAAASALSLCGSPVYLALQDYTQIQASGLQITRTPGKNVVYLGSVLLATGVFLMFYVPHQRIWVIAEARGGRTHLFVAGQRVRPTNASSGRNSGACAGPWRRRWRAPARPVLQPINETVVADC